MLPNVRSANDLSVGLRILNNPYSFELWDPVNPVVDGDLSVLYFIFCIMEEVSVGRQEQFR